MLLRTVDPAKMQTVEAMIKAPDHREKMPHIIKTILEFAFLTYSGRSDRWLTSLHLHFHRMITLITDLPKGPIKGNSMRKLAAKVTHNDVKIILWSVSFFQTLLEILPPPLLDPVQRRLEEDELSPDLITILSLLSFYCQLPEAAA